MTTLKPVYNIDTLVEFSTPRLTSVIGKIKRIVDTGNNRKEVGYLIRAERPDEVKNHIFYIRESFLTRVLL